MSDRLMDCDRFDQWLLDGGLTLEGSEWTDHLAECDECGAQWHAHRMLAQAFADADVPELSPAFDAGLNRKVAAAVEIRPLRGWRAVALAAYAAVAIGLLNRAFRDVPLPTIDLSAPWVPVATLVAVPLSFLRAIAAARLSPSRHLPRGMRPLVL